MVGVLRARAFCGLAAPIRSNEAIAELLTPVQTSIEYRDGMRWYRRPEGSRRLAGVSSVLNKTRSEASKKVVSVHR